MSRLSKFFTVARNDGGEQLTWPGTVEGYPFVGQPPQNLKREEFEQLPLRKDFRCEIMHLPGDMARYCEIKDRIVNEWYFQLAEVGPEWDPAKDAYRVLLMWVEVAGFAPAPGKSYASNEHESVSDRPEYYLEDSFDGRARH